MERLVKKRTRIYGKNKNHFVTLVTKMKTENLDTTLIVRYGNLLEVTVKTLLNKV